MTDRQQSVFYFLIVFFFACGVGLLVYKNYSDYYQEKTAIDLQAASIPTVIPKFLKPAEETGPNTICKTNADCWCRNFDGTKFYSGKVQSTCNTSSNRCVACTYE